MNLKSELDKLAKVILDRANQPDTALADVTDAFKSVRDYYLNDAKLKNKAPPEEADEESFAGFQERLSEVENGGAEVGSHRGRRRVSS